jgi:hypothetical protein
VGQTEQLPRRQGEDNPQAVHKSGPYSLAINMKARVNHEGTAGSSAGPARTSYGGGKLSCIRNPGIANVGTQ